MNSGGKTSAHIYIYIVAVTSAIKVTWSGTGFLLTSPTSWVKCNGFLSSCSTLVYLLRCGDRFGETEGGKCQVHKSVLIRLNVFISIDDLQVKLQANQAGDERSRRGN